MQKVKVNYLELAGTSYEIGKQLALKTDAQEMYRKAPKYFSEEAMEEALEVYKKCCPGILEELRGFSDVSGISVKDMAYTWMTYLVPRCSGVAISGEHMTDGHTRLLRNYEFGIGEEDMTLCRTCVEGKYSHVGGMITRFGRTEGINDQGLAVSMSSCGIPVSNIPQMRAPEVKGLQFWAVIRVLLENCKNVEEALELLKNIPVAFNINLYLADCGGNVALYETINGQSAFKVEKPGKNSYLFGTNHIVLKALQQYEPYAMNNSVIRYQNIEKFMEATDVKQESELLRFALTKYPEGLTCYYYGAYFGTIKTVVLDTVEKRYTLCWMGQEKNGLEHYYVSDKMREESKYVEYEEEEPITDLFEMRPL